MALTRRGLFGAKGIRARSFGAYSGEDRPLASINVTPFVDVVLVLLIIFMITAAVVEFGLQVSVPPTTVATAQPQRDFQNVQISSDGRVFYNGESVSIYEIAARAKTAAPERPAVYVRIHRDAPWEIVAQVLAECRAASVEVNLVPRPLERNPRG